ncbi:MAG: hypothetical protein Q8Q12_16970, partial [bacterium]|nr:hypothetical protein [bacterium]
MKSLVFTAGLLCSLFFFPVSSPILAATRYVDGSASGSGDGTSWNTAFRTIQEGIAAASDGDTVIVAQGLYVENIRFHGKNILLTSTDPLDASVVSGTIIDGNQAGSVVTFSGAETETCVFSGFTVRNGSAERGGGICGGTHEKRCLASVFDNVISHNSASVWGGGIAYCDGMIQSNVIAYNSVGDGGAGLYYCGGTIKNNVIVVSARPTHVPCENDVSHTPRQIERMCGMETERIEEDENAG